jgi:putative ABC transport system ATP-binding protein
VDRAWFDTVIEAIGLRDRLGHRPSQLSAVSSSGSPAPGPSSAARGDLRGRADRQSRLRSGAEVLAFLHRAVRDFGQTIAMVTHDRWPRLRRPRGVPRRRSDVDDMTGPTAERVLERWHTWTRETRHKRH